MADTLINKMQHSGKDIKIPQDMIAQLPTTLQELDRAIKQAQATLEALGNIATVSANGNANQYLNGQGQFSTPPNTTYSEATTSAAGLMSAADKSKLNGVANNANNYSHPNYTTRSGGEASNKTLSYGGTFKTLQVTSDTQGHVTGVTERTMTMPAAPNSLPNGDTATVLMKDENGTVQWSKLLLNFAGRIDEVKEEVNYPVYGMLNVDSGGTGNWEGFAQGVFKHNFDSTNLNELKDYTVCQISNPVNAPSGESGVATLFNFADKSVGHAGHYSSPKVQIVFINNKLFARSTFATNFGSDWTQI